MAAYSIAVPMSSMGIGRSIPKTEGVPTRPLETLGEKKSNLFYVPSHNILTQLHLRGWRVNGCNDRH